MRITAGTPATLRHRFSVAPSGAVTVDAALDDGTAVLTDAPAVDSGDGLVFTVDLPATAADVPDRLVVVWDAGSGHLESDVVEIAGARFVNREAVLAKPGLSSADALLVDQAVDHVEERIEDWHGVAWVPRYRLERHRGGTGTRLHLERRPIRSLRRVAVDGTDQTGLDAWQIREVAGVVYAPAPPTRGALIEVGYEVGFDRAPADLVDAATEAAAQLVRDTLSRHTPTRAEFAEGTTWLIATASPAHGRLFGIPTVDAVIEAHRPTLGVMA